MACSAEKSQNRRIPARQVIELVDHSELHGGPTPDTPAIILEPPSDLNRMNCFLNLRVADTQTCYKERKAKGGHFLTEPLDNRGWEWRCYVRDPDGCIIEVGQYSESSIKFFAEYNA